MMIWSCTGLLKHSMDLTVTMESLIERVVHSKIIIITIGKVSRISSACLSCDNETPSCPGMHDGMSCKVNETRRKDTSNEIRDIAMDEGLSPKPRISREQDAVGVEFPMVRLPVLTSSLHLSETILGLDLR